MYVCLCKNEGNVKDVGFEDFCSEVYMIEWVCGVVENVSCMLWFFFVIWIELNVEIIGFFVRDSLFWVLFGECWSLVDGVRWGEL